MKSLHSHLGVYITEIDLNTCWSIMCIIQSLFRSVLTSSKELVDDKLRKQVLQKGLLLEFKKDSERILLAVTQKPDGRKNWIVSDQVCIETDKQLLQHVEY